MDHQLHSMFHSHWHHRSRVGNMHPTMHCWSSLHLAAGQTTQVRRLHLPPRAQPQHSQQAALSVSERRADQQAQAAHRRVPRHRAKGTNTSVILCTHNHPCRSCHTPCSCSSWTLPACASSRTCSSPTAFTPACSTRDSINGSSSSSCFTRMGETSTPTSCLHCWTHSMHGGYQGGLPMPCLCRKSSYF